MEFNWIEQSSKILTNFVSTEPEKSEEEIRLWLASNPRFVPKKPKRKDD